MRSPSTAGAEIMPSLGESFSASALSWTICQRKEPSDSLKHIITPLSPLTLGSRGLSLLVPTKTRPPTMTGGVYDLLPSAAAQTTCFPSLPLRGTTKSSRMPFSKRLTRFRDGVPPSMGSDGSAPTRDSAARARIQCNRIEGLRLLAWRFADSLRLDRVQLARVLRHHVQHAVDRHRRRPDLAAHLHLLDELCGLPVLEDVHLARLVADVHLAVH